MGIAWKNIAFGLGFSLFSAMACGQQFGNDQIVLSLHQRLADSLGLRVASWAGPGYRWAPESVLDSAGIAVQITQPIISIRLIGEKQFHRVVQVRFVWGDTLPMTAATSRADTLEARGLAQMRKLSPPELAGDDPRWYHRWLKPALVAGGSLAAILALYYFRTQNP